MRTLFFLLFVCAQLAAQTPDVYYRIDSTAPSTWYFTRQVVTTEATGNKVVQEYRTFFSTKASALVAADTALAINKRDSIQARRSLVATDSTKARIARAKSKPTLDGGFKIARPTTNQPAVIAPDKTPIINTKKPKKKRPK